MLPYFTSIMHPNTGRNRKQKEEIDLTFYTNAGGP